MDWKSRTGLGKEAGQPFRFTLARCNSLDELPGAQLGGFAVRRHGAVAIANLVPFVAEGLTVITPTALPSSRSQSGIGAIPIRTIGFHTGAQPTMRLKIRTTATFAVDRSADFSPPGC
jgi:hypothetical protein